MKIISHFQDYYDSCRGYGVDPKLVYIRKTEEIEIGWASNKEVKERNMVKALAPLTSISKAMPSFGDYHDHNSGVIAFCGKAYPFYIFQEKAYYQLSKLIQTMQNSNLADHRTILDSLLGERRRWRCSPWFLRYGNLNKKNWEDFCKETNLDLPDSLHIYFKAPVLLMIGKKLILNPRLNQYNFPSQVDPYQAYQELSMYIGNNLATQMDPEVNISDKIRAESRGFDKWSFRKHKDDNKKRKK